MNYKIVVFVYFTLLFTFIHVPTFAQVMDDSHAISIGRPTWETDWFQVEIFRQIIKEIGYEVKPAQTLETKTAYHSLEKGELDLWVNMAEPGHEDYITENIEIVGHVAWHGGVNGYLIDKTTAEKYKIKTLSDLKKVDIRKIFDYNRNGKAEILGCNQGWICKKLINHHLKAFALEDDVEQLSSKHDKFIDIALDRLKNSLPVLIYGYTPHWMLTEFKPGVKTMWLPVEFSSLPQNYPKDTIDSKELSTCLTKPCTLGFPIYHVRSAGHKKFLNNHPDIKELLRHIKIPMEDISEQNALMNKGETNQREIEGHAQEWIKENRFLVNQWLKQVRRTQSAHHRPIRLARPSWDSNWFINEVFRELLIKLGYQLEPPITLPNGQFYKQVAEGTVDLWTGGNQINHMIYLTGQYKNRLKKVKFASDFFKNQVLQGYVIDKYHADKYGIKNLMDLKDPEKAKIYDLNGNGKADLIGCDLNWSCGFFINYQLKVFGLEDTVEHIQKNHARLSLLALKRLRENQPVLLHVWSPSWLPGAFEIGKKSYWLPVPYKAMPEGTDTHANDTATVNGCASGKKSCRLGLPITDRKSVANSIFLKEHPDIKKLLELVKIPASDAVDINYRMFSSHGDSKLLNRFAKEWLNSHEKQVSQWINASKALQKDKKRFRQVKKQSRFGNQTFKVALKQFEPFVLLDTEKQTGFSVELWEALAKELGLNYQFTTVDSLAKLLDDVDRNAVDVGVSGIAMTSRREQKMDFTHAYFESGLQIMTYEDETRVNEDNILSFFSLKAVLVVFGLLFIVLIPAHIIWFIERRRNSSHFPQTYIKGIFEAFLWSSSIMMGREGWSKPLKSTATKILSMSWMFISYFIFIYFTASVTTVFTLQGIRDKVNGIEDVIDKRVVTVKHSVAEEYLMYLGVIPLTTRKFEDAIKMLKDQKADAIVFDAPILNYYLSKQNDKNFKLVGTPFFKQAYGFALQKDSQLREAINQTLLNLIEKGTYEEIRNKWFGRNVKS